MKILTILLLTTFTTVATELHMSETQALTEGYERQSRLDIPFLNNHTNIDYPKHSLDWPFEGFDNNFLGNNFIQYQPYPGVINGGYHGGNDMVINRDSWVYAPISGKLEAGHYTYTDFDNGGREKFWKPWPKRGAASSFEVALIDENNIRFELHHIDRNSLSRKIKKCLRQSTPCYVEKGVKVGQVYRWSTSFHYDHIHMNIIDQNTGAWLNPEHFFKLIKDTIAPKIKVLVRTISGESFWLEQNQFITQEIKDFIIVGSDQKNNSHFHQTPLYTEVSFNDGQKSTYDYRYSFNNDYKLFPSISDIFPLKVTFPDGKVYGQHLKTGYYPLDAQYLVRLPLPNDKGDGSFTITVKDIAGNETQFGGEYKL